MTTTVRLDADQWAWLRNFAGQLARRRGGRPDVSAALREILTAVMVEDLERVHIEKFEERLDEQGRVVRVPLPLRPGERDREAAEGIADAGPMSAGELRSIREGLGYSQAAFARHLRVDEGTISRLERGLHRVRPSLALRIRVFVREAMRPGK